MDAHFVVEQAGRAWSDLPFQFNGTGGVWRRDAIEAAGGWDDATITEDLDLIIRVKTSGRHGLFLMDPAPTGEVPEDFSTWQVQQERWSAGTAQVLSRTFSHIIEADLPLRSRIALLSMLSPAVFFPSLAVGIITLIIGTVLREGDMFFYWIEITFVMATALFAVIAITLPPYLRLKRGSIGRYLQLTLLAPFLYVRLALANALAVAKAGTGAESMREFKRTPKSGATDM
jgi:cellulose synthase/poly-beta-1,6-N-acetylglucosamine synthase-like glycosyltransferase